MKILVIFTGGTIGSRITGGWISPDGNTAYSLISDFKANSSTPVNFVCREPYFVLSENLSAENLNLLISELKNALSEDFDGIIVTHGTDTLHYSAIAAEISLKAELPIIFVSANYPIADERSNGRDNFAAAVDFICRKRANGVFIAYKNYGEQVRFHIPHKTLAYAEADDRIYSIEQSAFTPHMPLKGFTFCEKPHILVITAVPCDSFDYDLTKYKAVIMRPYHSGTLNTANAAFKTFCDCAQSLYLPIFLADAPAGTTYETVKDYRTLGIKPLSAIPFSYAYMRIWAGISLKEDLNTVFDE